MKKVETPELEKMASIRKDSQKIGEFLDWLTSQEITLARWGEMCCISCEDEIEQLISVPETNEQLLANYFSIDLVKCEKERQALLGAIREDGR